MNHSIDSETLRCSCKASMCFQCGECSTRCKCLPRRCSSRKKRFLDRRSAEGFIKQRSTARCPLYVYRCRECGNYHLTSNKQGNGV